MPYFFYFSLLKKSTNNKILLINIKLNFRHRLNQMIIKSLSENIKIILIVSTKESISRVILFVYSNIESLGC